VTLSFETGDAVDDIRCGLADGTTLWLQAKRACGADAQLRATAAQWVGQVGSLRDGDKIGLATAEPKGPVRNLGAALDRRRRLPRSRDRSRLVRLRLSMRSGTCSRRARRRRRPIR
jgi:hypothetical protein